jgi:hypothetical protein
VPNLNGNCCDDTDFGCCTDSQGFYEESLELKEQLKEHFNKGVNVHLYNYDISMDRILAKKKLNKLIKEKGFKYINEEETLKYATPAVVINGQLKSFGVKPQMELVIKEIKQGMEK